MNSRNLRKLFLNFFEKKGHKIVPSSSLLSDDPSVLFTTAGMQQFKKYFLGEKSPYGDKVASCQKCFRTSDIDEVGDKDHLTFLEMLGNFSFGSYFKEQAIKFAYEFLFEELKLSLKDAEFSVFKGDKDIAFDEESFEILKKLGIPEKKIKRCGIKDNFWGPTGKEGPCGPTTEIYFNNTEVWNLVFNEYYQDENKKLSPLKQKGVDTGMGLERLAMVCQGKSSVFETDLFDSFIKDSRIAADHIRGAVFLIADNVLPSNVEQGYVLRRILRRAMRYDKELILLAKKVIEKYKDVYPELKNKETDILTVIQNEKEKFEKTLSLGLKEARHIFEKGDVNGEDAFHLYDTYGFSLELTEELAREKGLKVNKQGFQKAFEKHQKISRAGAEKKFGGIGKQADYQAVKLHTATHLLHTALRSVLGEHVKQMGSDINSERLRFDFSNSEKMTEKQIKAVEDLVNEKIKEDLEVVKKEMSLQKALNTGALSFFREKYPEKVSVYSISDFSKEICAGPHVQRTSELGEFKISKEESSSAGIRRIKGVLV